MMGTMVGMMNMKAKKKERRKGLNPARRCGAQTTTSASVFDLQRPRS